MKNILIIILLLISASYNTIAQEEIKLKGKPNTLEECFLYLDKILSEENKSIIKNTPEDSLIQFHFPFGMWLRNDLGLWRDSKLYRYFTTKGLYHPDDISMIIIVSYHRYLNKKEIDFKGQILHTQSFYKDIDYIQQPDTLPTPYFISFGIGSGWGRYQDLKGINEYLVENEYPRLKSSYIPFQVSIAMHKERICVNADFLFKQNTDSDTSNIYRSEIKIPGMRFDFSYDVIKRHKKSYFLFGGINMASAYVKLDAPLNDSIIFDNIGKESNSIEIQKGPLSLLDIGFGIKSKSENLFHWNTKVGYAFNIGEAKWSVNRIDLGIEPKINVGGVFLYMTGYYNLNRMMMK